MLLQRSRTFIQSKSIIRSALKRFSQQTSKIIIDQNLLYPFSQSHTLKALNRIPILNNNIGKMVVLDKLSATDYSETYRAYDIENKTFVVQKNVRLDSLASWNQANLILRQQKLSPSIAIEYDDKKQNMKVINEFQNTILKDYFLYLKNCNQSSWLNERVRFYAIQIIQQLNALKKLGVELERKSLDPQKIFIERTTEKLKFYDFADFTVNDAVTSKINQRELFEIAKKTLMSLMNFESRDITEIFKEIEAEMQNLGIENLHTSINHQLNGDFYDQVIFDKLLRVLKEKESTKINSQNQEKSADLLSDLRIVYKKHAEMHKSKGDLKSALECYEKIMEIEESMGQTGEGIKSRKTEQLSSTTDSYVPPTSLSGKLAVLTMKVIIFLFTLTTAFVIFGLVAGVCFYGYYNLFTVGNEPKQEEKISN